MKYIVRLERSLRLRVESLNFPIWLRFSRVTLALADDPTSSTDDRITPIALADHRNAFALDDAGLPFIVVYRVFLPDTDTGEGYVWVFDLVERPKKS